MLKRCNSPWRLVLAGFLFTAALQLLVPISCKTSVDPDPSGGTGQIETEGLKLTTQTAETLFLNEDVPGVIDMLTPQASELLKDVVPILKPYLKSYGDAFKNRKLEFITPLYAEYSFRFEGKKVSVAFSHDENDKWKLIRL